nr:hypothetical protein [uncultured Allomuricauda sp.]
MKGSDKIVIIIDKEPIYITVFKSICKELTSEINIKPQIISHLCVDEFLYQAKSLDMHLSSKEVYLILDANYLGQKQNFQFKKKVLKVFSEYKVKIVLTITRPDYFVYGLAINELMPVAFIVKSEVNIALLKKALQDIFNNKSFYSVSVLDFIKINVLSKNQLDQTDKSIIYFLSKGYRVIELPDKVNLSLSAVEWRKRKIKKLLGLCDSKVQTIIDAGKRCKII